MIALKFDWHIGSSAADVSVKFQSDTIIQTTSLTAPILHVLLDIETGPWRHEQTGITKQDSDLIFLEYSNWAQKGLHDFYVTSFDILGEVIPHSKMKLIT